MLPVTPSLAAFPPASPSGASQACPQAASAGGSIPFVDPALTAPEAPIHWLTEPGTPTLHAVARRAPSATLADVALIAQPCIGRWSSGRITSSAFSSAPRNAP